MQTQSYAEIFEDMADVLTSENWRKEAYFKEDQGQLCMCAHGALQARVNPEVKSLLRSGVEGLAIRAAMMNKYAAAPAVWRRGVVSPASAYERLAGWDNRLSPQEIWDLRPSWARSDYIYNGKNYGKREAHYLLGIVGLTVAFNDASSTTLEMVREKFREAAQLARELGV